jgi:hypothetical protein
MFWRALRVAFSCAVVAAIAAPACGGSSSSDGQGQAGGAGSGAGGSAAGSGPSGGAGRNNGTAGKPGTPTPVPCGAEMCKGISLPQAQLEVPGCCADAKTNTCGIDTSGLPNTGGQALPACQPVAPAGKPDTTCPSSPAIPLMGISVTAPGCCQPSGVCGYDLDRVGGFISLGLGCLDSSQFLDGGASLHCGGGVGTGDGGMGGAGPGLPGDAGASGSADGGSPAH